MTSGEGNMSTVALLAPSLYVASGIRAAQLTGGRGGYSDYIATVDITVTTIMFTFLLTK